MHGASFKKNHTSVCMTVPINVTDYPEDCKFVFVTFLLGILKHFCVE